MSVLKRSAALGSFVIALLAVTAAHASMTAQMNLEQLVTKSERVFVGQVIDISETRVSAGGGELPAVVYRLRVSEAFKGNFETVKGEQVAEVMMVGRLKDILNGRHPITDFPVLAQGQEYLLFIAQPGPTGLTSPMGFGQGAFNLTGADTDRVAMNLVNNAGLFAGMQAPGHGFGPVRYSELAEMIRDIAAEGAE